MYIINEQKGGLLKRFGMVKSLSSHLEEVARNMAANTTTRKWTELGEGMSTTRPLLSYNGGAASTVQTSPSWSIMLGMLMMMWKQQTSIEAYVTSLLSMDLKELAVDAADDVALDVGDTIGEDHCC